jgi:hypothetical protein
MSAPSIPVSDDKWRWHQAFAIGLCFVWPALGKSYLSLDERDDTWSAKCGMLYALTLLLWIVVTPTTSIQLIIGIGLLWVLMTWGIALWCIPGILRARKIAARVYKPYAVIVPLLWIALAAFNVFAFSPWARLAIMTAPANASPLLPIGTPYFALGFDRYDPLNRGQLITYRAGQELRIARVIAVPGDITRIDRTSFFVNGAQFTATTGQPSNRDYWSLRDLAQALRHPGLPEQSRTIFDLEDFTVALASAPAGSVTRVDRREILVADHVDLLEMSKRTLMPTLVKIEDVVAIPVAKVWSLDEPGPYSDIAQPSLEFER